MNDSRDFQGAESVRSGHSHVASQSVSFPLHPDPGGMLSRSLGMPSRKNGPPSTWDTHGISGNVLCSSQVSDHHTDHQRWLQMQFEDHPHGSFSIFQKCKS